MISQLCPWRWFLSSKTVKIQMRYHLIWVYAVCQCTLSQISSLFDLILYAPVNNLSVKSGQVFLGWTSTKLGLMCLAKGHNAVMPVRLKPAALRSQVKHSTTEPLHSHRFLVKYNPISPSFDHLGSWYHFWSNSCLLASELSPLSCDTTHVRLM